MSLSTVLFLFLAHLGVGIAFTLALVSSEAGIKFFRFNSGLAAVLLAVALAFRPVDGAAGSGVALGALVLCEAALVVYWATIGRLFTKIREVFVWTAIASGTIALVLQALALTADRASGMEAVSYTHLTLPTILRV